MFKIHGAKMTTTIKTATILGTKLRLASWQLGCRLKNADEQADEQANAQQGRADKQGRIKGFPGQSDDVSFCHRPHSPGNDCAEC